LNLSAAISQYLSRLFWFCDSFPLLFVFFFLLYYLFFVFDASVRLLILYAVKVFVKLLDHITSRSKSDSLPKSYRLAERHDRCPSAESDLSSAAFWRLGLLSIAPACRLQSGIVKINRFSVKTAVGIFGVIVGKRMGRRGSENDRMWWSNGFHSTGL
jgi:hypothetical protein